MIKAFQHLPSTQIHNKYRRNIKSNKFGHLHQTMQLEGDTEVTSKAKLLFYSQKSFEDLGLAPKMVDVVKSLNIVKPSKIQALSFYGINSGKPCIIADQTGSGKTLAYLLPVIQRMLSARKMQHESSSNTVVRSSDAVSPYLVIMTPTAELAMYVKFCST